MVGTDRVRACSLCQLNVYNLSGMSSQEARHFVSRAEGRACLRYFRRADGTVITADCPEAAEVQDAERARPRQRLLTAVALVALLAGADTITQAAWSALHSALLPAPELSYGLGTTSPLTQLQSDLADLASVPIR